MAATAHVYIATAASRDDARALAMEYMARLPRVFPIVLRMVDGMSDTDIAIQIARDEAHGAYVVESTHHTELKGRKRGYVSRWFCAVHAPGEVRTSPQTVASAAMPTASD